METVLQRRCGHCVHLKLAILVSSRCYPYYLYCRCHKHYLLAKVPTSTTPTLAASKKKIYTLTMGLSMMYSSGIKFLPFCLAETARGLSTQSWRLKGDEDDENDHQQHHQPPTTPRIRGSRQNEECQANVITMAMQALVHLSANIINYALTTAINWQRNRVLHVAYTYLSREHIRWTMGEL